MRVPTDQAEGAAEAMGWPQTPLTAQVVLPDHPRLCTFEEEQGPPEDVPGPAPVLRLSEGENDEAPAAVGFPSSGVSSRWSGRLDLNRRPLAPQAHPLTVDGLAGHGTASQVGDITDTRAGIGAA